MTVLEWDGTGQRKYETGVDHGVLFPVDINTGDYGDGVAWNGLTTVTESPSGAESNPQYADNIKYLDLYSAEDFAGTIEAFTYPDEFEACDGTASPADGVYVSQQQRQPFGLSYRTKIGNDVLGTAYGQKIHLVYGAKASPSEKARSTVNESPEALPLSWEFTTTALPVPGLDPSAHIVIDSTKSDPDAFAEFLEILYGDEATDPRLPLPAEVIDLFTGSTTVARLTGDNSATYNSGTHVVTLPAVTGVQWKINGVNKTAGAQPAMTVGQTSVVTATALPGYRITGDNDWTFDY